MHTMEFRVKGNCAYCGREKMYYLFCQEEEEKKCHHHHHFFLLMTKKGEENRALAEGNS